MPLAYSKNFTHANHNYNLFYNMQKYVSPPNYGGADKIPIQFQVLGYGSGSSYTFGYYLILSDNTNAFDETLGSVFDSHNILLQQGTISASESGSTDSDNIQTITFSKEYLTELSKFPNTATLYVKIILTPTRANDTVVQQNISFNYSHHPYLRPVFTLEDPVVLKRQHPLYNTPESWGLTQNVSVFSIETSQIQFSQNATFKSANFQVLGSDVNLSITSLNEDGTIDTWTDKPISISGDLVFRMTVIDSRNISSVVDKVVKVYSYKLPSISSFEAMRANDDRTIDEDGTNILINLMGKADITQSNFIRSLSIIQIVDTLTGEVVPYDQETNIEIVNPLTQNPDASNQYNIGKVSYFIKGNLFKSDREYKITAGIVDEYVFIRRPSDVPTSETKVYRSYCTIDLLAGGLGVAFGTTATKEGFECDMVADFNKTLNVDGNTTLNGTLNVAQVTNLKNGLTVTGTSTFSSQVNLNGIVNYPNSPDIRIGNGRTRTSVKIGETNTNHYYAIADTGTVTNSYSDKTAILLVSNNYVGGKTGILRISQRTNEQSASSATWSSCEIQWLSNNGWETDAFILRYTSAKSNNRAILYYNSKRAHASISVTVLHNGPRAGETAAWVISSPLTYSNAVASMSLSSQIIPTLSGGMGSQYVNSYYGLMNPQRDASNWIRTSGNGFIPYKPGGGSSSLGTSAWPFNQVVSQHLSLGPAGSVEKVKDVVVAQGESSGWKWRKWASGRAEVWGWKSVSVYTSTAWGNMYYGGPFVSGGAWPFTWHQNGPITQIRYEDGNGRFWHIYGGASTTQSPIGYAVSAVNYGSQAIAVCIYATGWWRASNYNRI